MSRAEVVKNSAKMNCLCFANLNCRCSWRAGNSTSHLLITKLEEIICISPGFPCTEPFQMEVFWLHTTCPNISPPLPFWSLQCQLDSDVLLWFSVELDKSLKQSISQPWQTKQSLEKNVLNIAKIRGKKCPYGVTSKGQDSSVCPWNLPVSHLHKRFCQQLLGPVLFSTEKVQNPWKQKDPPHESKHMVLYVNSYQQIISWKFLN